MRYDMIFMDIDNTLLDFDAGTRESLKKLLARFGIVLTEELLRRFLQINDGIWRQYERGEIEKAQIFSTRFKMYLGELGVDCDPLEANEWYAQGLRESAVPIAHSMELLQALKGRCRMFGVTNGVVTTQTPRLAKSGLREYFEQVFISEQMGCKKPEKEFFDKVFAAIGQVDKHRCILLGDSLSSDMQGGRNAGIATCFYGKPTDDPRCDYVIGDLLEFLNIVEP